MTFIMKMIRDWVMNRAISAIASELKRREPAIVDAALAYRDKKPFVEVVRAYTKTTPHTDDDAVITDLITHPFSEVLPQIAAPIANTTIPDLDSDEENDVTIGDFLSRIIDAILEKPQAVEGEGEETTHRDDTE